MNLRPTSAWPSGRIVTIEHESVVLRDNPWNDPTRRSLSVYLPPGYREGGRELPSLWDLAAYSNCGPGHLNWRGQGETLVQRLDRLIFEKKIGPCLVVFADCYTSLGGNQYINSSAVGAYADYLEEELVPLVSEHFNVINGRQGRGAFGKSSGAYGALVHAMYYPDTWGAIACHAPDMQFDLVYRPDFPKICVNLAAHNHDIKSFLRYFWRCNRPGKLDYLTLMAIGMAATYDPDPSETLGFALPFDLHTCELNQERWQSWLAHDPIKLLPKFGERLKRLRGFYLDVGSRDQYNIQFGMRVFHRELERAGIAHRFEEFDGTHSGMDFRLDYSLPFLYQALNPAQERAQ